MFSHIVNGFDVTLPTRVEDRTGKVVEETERSHRVYKGMQRVILTLIDTVTLTIIPVFRSKRDIRRVEQRNSRERRKAVRHGERSHQADVGVGRANADESKYYDETRLQQVF